MRKGEEEENAEEGRGGEGASNSEEEKRSRKERKPCLGEEGGQHEQDGEGGHDARLEVVPAEDEGEVGQDEQDHGGHVDGDDGVTDAPLQHHLHLRRRHGPVVVRGQAHLYHLPGRYVSPLDKKPVGKKKPATVRNLVQLKEMCSSVV